MFNSHWHHCSTVGLVPLFNWGTGMIVNSGTEMIIQQQEWHDCLTITWHNYSIVIGTIVQQSLALLISIHRHDSSIVGLVRLFNIRTSTIDQEWCIVLHYSWYIQKHWRIILKKIMKIFQFDEKNYTYFLLDKGDQIWRECIFAE